jgi:hypothetical protein
MSKAAQVAMDRIQERIRKGEYGEARPLILKLSARRLTREQRLRLAHLCNQAALHTRALTLLGRLVRPGKGAASQATPEEKVEYARALGDLGCQGEVIQLLTPLDPGRLPRVAAVLSFAHFRRWEWERTIPYLKRVLGAPGVTGRPRFLLELRLGTALLHGAGDPSGGARILERLANADADTLDRRLRLEVLSMLAQCRFYEKRWSDVLALLDERERLFREGDDSVFALNGRKWRTLVEMARGNPAAALPELTKIIGAYRTHGHWEQVRSCEYYAAALLGDEKRVNRFCFGTPYPAARDRLLRSVGREPSSLPETYAYELGPAGARRDRLAVLDGESPFSPARLKPGQAPQRMLQALVRDFYVPPTAMVLHERLYPGDYFNPSSSPFRVSQVMKRLRRWLSGAKVPLKILEEDGAYRVDSDRPLSIILRRSSDLADGGDGRLAALAAAFQAVADKPFRASDVETRLGLRRSAAVALLRDAIAAGGVERIGVGAAVRYRLKAR